MDCETNKYHLLEQMLLDSNKEPTDLPLSLLKAITHNFSEDRKIGSGGFADVYEGRLHNGSVAVKRLFQAINMDEKNFIKEVANLIRVKHQNVVRFLGYCADTQGKVEKYGGKMVMADVQQRLLCFEFLPNGCLDKHLKNVASGGLEWRTCYQIIKGLCRGLHYLHQENIVHLDLKPANILLDYNMVPKISDFGLSRCFEEKQTREVTTKMVGTLGYMAPEFINSGVITIKSDIYSLGIIIIEILTGQKEYLRTESVLECWNTRFQMSHGVLWLEHARVCAKIGLECMDSDPGKRPIARQIIERLDELECTHGLIETNHPAAIPELDVYPLNIRFPFEQDKLIKCPVTLTNKTDNLVGVCIKPSSLDACSNPGYPYVWDQPEHITDEPKSSLFIRLEPHSSKAIYITMRNQEQHQLQEDKGLFDVVMIPTKSEEVLKRLYRYWNHGTMVYGPTLRAAVTRDPARYQPEVVEAHQFIKEGGRFICCMDVHPTEKWLLVGYSSGHVSIWNYETQERVIMFQVKNILSIKFIAGEHWFAAGDDKGGVHVYTYNIHAENYKVKEFNVHRYMGVTHLAVHPKHTLLLTLSCNGKSIKLWDWSQGWMCTRVIDTQDPLYDLKVGPRDTSTFASTSYSNVTKVWDIHSPDAIATFEGSRLTFYTDDRHQNFLASLCYDRHTQSMNAKIWDLHTKQHVHTLCPGMSIWGLVKIAVHPSLPILAGIVRQSRSKMNPHILLWDVRTYRVMKRIELVMLGNNFLEMLFDGTEDITSLVVASDKEISIIKINVPKLLTD